jgi:hypothetical protein
MDNFRRIEGKLQGNQASVIVSNDMCPLNVEVRQESPAVFGLLRNAHRRGEMRATREATAVVSDYTVVLREDRLLQQWSETVDKDASVHKHDRLSQALDFEL